MGQAAIRLGAWQSLTLAAREFDCTDPSHILDAFKDAGSTAGCAIEELGERTTDKYFEKICTADCEHALHQRALDLLKLPDCSEVHVRRQIHLFGNFCARDPTSNSRYCFSAERKKEFEEVADAIATASPVTSVDICSNGCFEKSMVMFALGKHNTSADFPLHLKYFCLPNPAAGESGAAATCWQDYLSLIKDDHLLRRLEETPSFICQSPCNTAAFADAARLRGGDVSYALALHEFACMKNELGFYCYESMQGLKRSVNVVNHDGTMMPRPHCPGALGRTSPMSETCSSCSPWCQQSEGYSCQSQGLCVDYSHCGPGGYGVAECACTTFLAQLQEEHGCCLSGMIKLSRQAHPQVSDVTAEVFAKCGIRSDPRCSRGIGRTTTSFELTVLGARSKLCGHQTEVRPAGAVVPHDPRSNLQDDLEEVFAELLCVSPEDLDVEMCTGSVRSAKDTTKIVVRAVESEITSPKIVEAAKLSQERSGELQLAAEEVVGAAISKVSRISIGSQRGTSGDYSGTLQAVLERARHPEVGAMVVNDSGNRSGASGTGAPFQIAAVAVLAWAASV